MAFYYEVRRLSQGTTVTADVPVGTGWVGHVTSTQYFIKTIAPLPPTFIVREVLEAQLAAACVQYGLILEDVLVRWAIGGVF